MKVEICWFPVFGEDLVAEKLAGPLSQRTRIPLLPPPLATLRSMKGVEVLTCEVENLFEESVTPGFLVPIDMATRISILESELRNAGVSVYHINIDGLTLLHFAAQQQRLAAKRYAAMTKAIDMLRKTRSWFKDRRLGEIRQFLESSI